MKGIGFPHSDISGSKRACRSPELFAAYHVLRRLVMPRHPSHARIRLAEELFLSSISFYVAILFPDYAVFKDQAPLIPEDNQQ